jgi:hypothetical protein
VQLAECLVAVLAVYGLAGAVFAAAFVLFGIHRVDPVAEHSPIGFRIIVMPGVAALWPFLLARWFKALSRSH